MISLGKETSYGVQLPETHQEVRVPGPQPRGGPPKALGGRRALSSGHTRLQGSRQNCTGMKGKGKAPPSKQGTDLRVGTWNVRTMQPGLGEDLRKMDDNRKTAVINNELLRLNVDICALQETRLAGNGHIEENDYKIFFQGKPETDKREYGVGFAIRNSLLSSVDPNIQGTERLGKMKLQTESGFVHLICAYAPTLHAEDDTKDLFYSHLESVIKEIPSSDQILLLGDFNARTGSDKESWPIPLGPQGFGKMNDNGQRLLEICTLHRLCITNSFFQTKPQHKVSWQHPRTKIWHQIDYVITRRDTLKDVKLTRTYHSADCDTDHSLVISKIRLSPKRTRRKKNPGKPKLNVENTANPELSTLYNSSLKTALNLKRPDEVSSTTEKWNHIRDSIYESASSSFGRKRKRNKDWFRASHYTLNPAIEKKKKALIRYKNISTRKSQQHLKEMRKETRKLARQCANNYWVDLASKIQSSADSGNIRGMYEGIKEATGPAKKRSAPLKTKDGNTITNKDQQMKRWAEHYSEVLGSETVVKEEALLAIVKLPCMDELDEPPTIEELSKEIENLPSGKAAGMDAISPELIKNGKEILLDDLHKLLLECWETGDVPQEMRDCKITTLYKNKGCMSDCNNYRGISLLSIVGKLFAKVALRRLQQLAERVYPESQCGFRASRSTHDMIFSVRQMQEKCREQNVPLYMVFIDLTKAFDLVSRNGLFKILELIGCPPKLHDFVKNFHNNMKGVVEFDGSTSEPFNITSGVKQGCVLAPTLFGIFFAIMLQQAFKDTTEGVLLHTRTDGSLFNLARLKAKTLITKPLIRDLLFADDAAVMAHSPEELQTLLNGLSKACSDFGLTISIAKTKVLVQGVLEHPNIKINDTQLEVVSEFPYLGSLICDDLALDKEIDRRIGKACSTLSRLSERVWENAHLSNHTKILVYRACVLSTLLYGSESWTLYAHQQRKLNVFHMRCLRRILNVHWSDKITNNKILDMAGIQSLYTILRQQRLRWLGHVIRMTNDRIPKMVLFSELASGARKRGKPILRYKDCCKEDLQVIGVTPESLQTVALDRDAWRHLVYEGLRQSEAKMREEADIKREARKSRANQMREKSTFVCSQCHKDCHANIGLISHKKKCPGKPPNN